MRQNGGAGTQFTCFTSTKVQILTAEALQAAAEQRNKKKGEICCVASETSVLLTKLLNAAH
jgi:hypothetical protein